MMSCTILYADESITDVAAYLGKAVAYVNPRGGLLASPLVDTVRRVIYNFSGD